MKERQESEKEKRKLLHVCLYARMCVCARMHICDVCVCHYFYFVNEYGQL